jgi:hypothetical protein
MKILMDISQAEVVERLRQLIADVDSCSSDPATDVIVNNMARVTIEAAAAMLDKYDETVRKALAVPTNESSAYLHMTNDELMEELTDRGLHTSYNQEGIWNAAARTTLELHDTRQLLKEALDQ